MHIAKLAKNKASACESQKKIYKQASDACKGGTNLTMVLCIRQVEKHRLVHELNVSYRDLRILDPLASPKSPTHRPYFCPHQKLRLIGKGRISNFAVV